MLCVSNNGLSFRRVAANYVAAAGEVLFSDDPMPTAAQLGAAFPGYAAAVSALALQQQAQAMLAAGCQVVSSGTPALSGTYPTDAASQAHINAEATSILLNGTFTDGTSSIVWLDVAGDPHTFSIAQFKTLATALAAYVTACLKVINGQSTTLSAQPSTIA